MRIQVQYDAAEIDAPCEGWTFEACGLPPALGDLVEVPGNYRTGFEPAAATVCNLASDYDGPASSILTVLRAGGRQIDSETAATIRDYLQAADSSIPPRAADRLRAAAAELVGIAIS